MTKREILKFIEAKRSIEVNSRFNEVINSRLYQGFINDKNLLECFVDIAKVEEDFKILKEEVDKSLDKVKMSKEVVKNLSGRCNHEVRLKQYGFAGYGFDCVFCGKSITDDYYENFEDSVNRNRHSVTFNSNVFYDEDGEECIVSEGYSYQQVYDLIVKILEDKDMEEEINLVSEFKKLNISDVVIRDEKLSKEDYILIVCGSNKESLTNGTYISRESDVDISIKFLKYFKDMLNLKLCFISSEEVVKTYHILDEQSRNLKIMQYNSLDSLLQCLDKVRDIPFKCILDFSNLFTYCMSLERLDIFDYSVPVENIFPNSLYLKSESSCKDEKIRLSGPLKSIDGSIDEVSSSVRKLIKSK